MAQKFNKKKENTGGKYFALGGISLLLVAILVVIWACGSAGFTQNNPIYFFNNWGKGTISSYSVDIDNNFVLSNYEENGIALMSEQIPAANYKSYGISTRAKNAFTLTATVLPDAAEDKSLSWAGISWADGLSTWAEDKSVTDYLTITPTDNENTVVVTCLQPFGEQALLTVSSAVNPLAKATCKIDYAQRITAVSIDIYGNAAKTNLFYTIPATGDTYTCTQKKVGEFEFPLGLTPEYGVYSLECEYTYKFYFTYNTALLNAFKSYGLPLISGADAGRKEVTAIEPFQIMGQSFIDLNYNDQILEDFMLGAMAGMVQGYYASYKQCLKEFVTNGNAFGTLDIVCESKYDTFYRTVALTAAPDLYNITATNVNLNEDQVVF